MKEVTALKNIFGCEAHNELVRKTYKMIYESRIACSKPGIELIQKLQNMEYI